MHLAQVSIVLNDIDDPTEDGTFPGTDIFRPGLVSLQLIFPRSIISGFDDAIPSPASNTAGSQLDIHLIAT
jgi:hypothetical protein